MSHSSIARIVKSIFSGTTRSGTTRSGTTRVKGARFASLVLPTALSFGLLLSACSSSDSAASGTSAESIAADSKAADSGETYELVSDAEVAAGFAKVKPLVTKAAEQIDEGDKKAADATVTNLYTTWYTFEGTVRKVDQSRYLDLEDALGSLKTASASGDKDKGSKASADFLRIADSYLADHPTGAAEVADQVAAAAGGPATPVDVQLADYSILAPDELVAGVQEFTLDNVGKLVHEFIVFRTDLAPESVPLDAQGGVDEKGAGVTFIDEKEDIKVGETAKLRVDLPAGRYLFACNTPGHWANKMYKVVTVK